ncbi:MAG: hypothetical protein IKI26_11080 [Prevotella sp.]|nr:hypothetical protein [Prevotella sp.]
MPACSWHSPNDLTQHTSAMLKTYIADTEMCINVRVGEGHAHVAFIPHTLGGSSLATDDPLLQEAIERHRHFGTRIHLAPPTEPEPPARRQENKERKPEHLTFTSLNDAKDYCADTFGVSRTLLRTVAQIEALAAENGIIIHIK